MTDMLHATRATLALTLLVPLLAGCRSKATEATSLYRYESRELLKYLHQHGYAADTIEVAWQNPAGTKVYFQEPMHVTADGTRTVWVASETHPRPRPLVLPVGAMWLDEQDRPRTLPLPARDLDHQTAYFFYQEDQIVRVGHIAKEDGWLFEFETDRNGFAPDRIWAVDGAILLEDAYDQNQGPGDPDNLWVFRPDPAVPGAWTKEERRLNVSVRQADYGRRQLLCESHGSMLLPLPPLYSLYDVGTAKRTGLWRTYAKVHHFFLASDFLPIPRRKF